MAPCLYCVRDASPTGFHPACVPRPSESQVAVQETPRPGVSTYTPPVPHAAGSGGHSRVKIVDFDIPMSSMVTFMVKWSIAAIPALIILTFLGLLIAATARAFLSFR